MSRTSEEPAAGSSRYEETEGSAEREDLMYEDDDDREETPEHREEDEMEGESETMKMMGLMMSRMFERMERERKLERDRLSRREKLAEERRREREAREEQIRRDREAEERAYRMEQDKILQQLRQEELRLKERELKMIMEKEERDGRLQQEKEQRTLQMMREKEARKERINAVHMPTAMTSRTDLLEYLQLFERTVTKKEIPREAWADALFPLLNDKYRNTAIKLPEEIQANYTQLKEALLKRDEANIQNAAATFWNYTKKPGTTVLEEVQTLSRLASRFITGDDRQTCIDQLTKEWVIQRLPKEARSFVRERKPGSTMDMAELVEHYFSCREESYAAYRGITLMYDQGKQEDKETKHYPYRKDHNSRGYRDSRKHSSPQRETHDKQESSEEVSRNQQKEKSNPKNTQESSRRSSEPFKCFNCGKVGHMARECTSRKPQKINRVQEVETCQLCDGGGHGAKECALRVNKVDLQPKGEGKPMAIRQGRIQGQATNNILLDSGAQVSVIAQESLPEGYRQNGMVRIKTITSPVTQHPAALVDVEIGEQKFTVRAAVLKKQDILHDLILGENVPRMSIHDLLDKTLQAIPKPVQAEATHQHQEEPEKDEPGQVNQLQLVNVVTRAQQKKTEQTEEADRRATAESQADITDWDKVEALSTEPGEQEEEQPMPSSPTSPTDRRQMAKAQREDETLSELFQLAKQEDSCYRVAKGLLWKESTSRYGDKCQLLVVPRELRRKVWETSHSSKLAGHFGSRKTLKKIVGYFYWPGITRDVAQWCKACDVCQRHNMGTTQRSPLRPLPIIAEPWTRVAIDIVGPLPRTTSGYRYILTAMDFASRYPEAIPLKRVDAPAVANALLEILSRYGIPDELLSDNGSVFTGKVMQSLCETLEIDTIRTTPYHPQSNGMLERFHRTLKSLLSKIDQPEKWATSLPVALFAARDTPHAATGFTPFQVLFGHEVNGPAATLHRVWTGKHRTSRRVVEYVEALRSKMAKAVVVANDCEREAKEKSKDYYDKSTKEDALEEGTEVLLLHPAASSGWRAAWEGPYTVLSRVTPVTYRISTPGKRGAVVHRNSLKRYHRTYQVNHVVIADGSLDADDQLRLPGLPGTNTVETSRVETDVTLTEEQKKQLQELKSKYGTVISTIPGNNKDVCMEIEVEKGKPISIPPYRIPIRWRDKLAAEIKTLLDLEVIEPSSSPWAAPVVCVMKPDGSLRMCVDYRALNKVTKADPFPMPRIEELLERVAPAKFISTLDLNKGYYQVPLSDSAKEKTAFITPQGKFQFRKMPFGLCNAPSLFQRMMNNILSGHQRAAAYIDDIVVTSTTWKEHLEDLQEVLERLQKAGLTVKESKCTFAKATVSFLGHNVGRGTITPQASKLKALRDYPRPQTKKELRSFLGFIGYYRRFVPEFASKSALLSDATAKDRQDKVEWSQGMIDEFELLKQTLLDASALHSFDPEKMTRLHTDASDRGLGAVLLQVDREGNEFPIAYYSKKLLPRQTRYSVSEKECLALVEAIRHFESYLLGGTFEVITDHKALLALPRTTSGGAKITRWALALQPFRFTIKHKPGKQHLDADALSRQPEPETPVEPCSPTRSGTEGWRGGCRAQHRAHDQDQDLWSALVQARAV